MQRVLIRVVPGEAFEADDDMRLLKPALQPRVSAEVARRGGRRVVTIPFRDRGEAGSRLVEDARVLDRTRGADDHAVAGVMVGEIPADRGAVEAGDALRRPEDRPTDRLVGIGGGVEHVEDEVVRRVLDGTDLLQDDALLALELDLVEGRLGQDVGENVEREIGVLGEEVRVVGRLLGARRRVEVAACGFDFFRNGARRAAPRPLEGHVLEQVREPMLGRRLVPRPGADPDAERGGLEVAHAVGDDAQARGQGGDLDAHEAAISARPWSTRARMKRSISA